MSQALEERFLFFLLLLRQPRLRMVYVTSQPINPQIVDYYLSLLPGVIPGTRARGSPWSRSTTAAPSRSSRSSWPGPGSSPDLRDLVPDRSLSHLVPYNTTTLERDLALLLGIPMYGADPRLFPLGTKTGCRRLFARAGVRYPLGVEDLHSAEDLEEAVVALRAERPGLRAVMVKLNEGVAGAGNAVVHLSDLPAPGTPEERHAVAQRVAGHGARGHPDRGRRLPRQARGARRHRRGAGGR